MVQLCKVSRREISRRFDNYDLNNHIKHYKYLLNFVSYNAKVSELEDTEGYRRIKEKLDLLKKLKIIE